MRIYYFGKLIEDTNETKNQIIEQTALDLLQPEEPKPAVDSLGDLLNDLDLSLDIWRPAGARG